MNVASLDLCKRLFELSGWNDADCEYWSFSPSSPALELVKGLELLGEHVDTRVLVLRTKVDYLYEANAHVLLCPAYGLEYLLRKLPETPAKGVHWRQKRWNAEYLEPRKVNIVWEYADTPEDAVAKLAIKLIRQGILAPTTNTKDKEP